MKKELRKRLLFLFLYDEGKKSRDVKTAGDCGMSQTCSDHIDHIGNLRPQ